MSQAEKSRLALRVTVFGFLVHYAYAIILFSQSLLTERMTPSFAALYVAAAGAPNVLLCVLVLRKSRRSPETESGPEKDAKELRP